MHECLYLLAAVLEVVGIAWVVSDVRSDFASVRTMVATRHQPESATSPVARDTAIVDELVESLSRKGLRRLWGPGLVVAGVIVGLAANLAAL